MKKTLLYLILIMSIIMAGTVAYVSVGGLLKVFSGAGTLGLILFASIEVAKIVATSAIHTYGKILGWFYNTLLSLGILIAMAITSMGIYGFLSSTYKESFSKMESIDSRLELIESKSNGYKTQLTSLNEEKESINKTISELSKGLSNNVIEYKDKETGQIIRTTSSATRKTLEKQLDRAVSRQSELNTKIDELSNTVFDLDNQALEVKLGNDVASELGPLKYLAEVTGTDMDNVMKWFILLLIVIGDPMAVLMVIIFNKVANIERIESTKKDESKDDDKEDLIEESIYNTDGTLVVEPTIEDLEEDKEEVQEDIEDLEEDKEEVQEDIEEIQEDIDEIEDDILESLKENTEIDTDLLQRLKDLEEKEKELKQREADVNRLDDEIKTWENTHWKLRRNRKPPSAIE